MDFRNRRPEHLNHHGFRSGVLLKWVDEYADAARDYRRCARTVAMDDIQFKERVLGPSCVLTSVPSGREHIGAIHGGGVF
jgi:hypothetical protein